MLPGPTDSTSSQNMNKALDQVRVDLLADLLPVRKLRPIAAMPQNDSSNPRAFYCTASVTGWLDAPSTVNTTGTAALAAIPAGT